MCGIIGYVGPQGTDVTTILLDGLSKLEYRGYDSAGIAVLTSTGSLELRRHAGKIANLVASVDNGSRPDEGSLGIGHTRWATHGRPNDVNAHPHSDCTGVLTVVHNGIIENYAELRQELAKEGHTFRSETDTEILSHLIERSYFGQAQHDLEQSIRLALQSVIGSYAIAVVSREQPDLLIGARHGGGPLIVGLGENEQYLSSGLIAKYAVEKWARIPVEVITAAEFRYCDPIVGPETLCIAVTQSGETADTLVGIRQAREHGAPVITVTNVVASAITRLSDAVLYLQAGPEICVVATKSFISSVTVLYLLGMWLGQQREKITAEEIREWLETLERIPVQIQQVLDRAASPEDVIAPLAQRMSRSSSMIFIGRGVGYPTALEGALKLKEISYIHAEGFPAGELKHGSIALLDPDTPLIAVATASHVYEKVVSNIQEVRARDARVIVVATEGDEAIRQHADDVLYVPSTLEVFSPLLASIPLQLFAYHAAVARGCNVDQPRNLAKSVTVE